MAIIFTTVIPDAEVISLDSPAADSSYFGIQPLGYIHYSGTAVIPAKILTDTSLLTLTYTLPRGFFYQLQDLAITALSDQIASINSFERLWYCTLSENGVQRRNFTLQNIVPQAEQLNGLNSFLTILATLQIATAFKPHGWPRRLIDGGDARAFIRTVWLDNSATATNEVTVSFDVRFLQFTIEQARNSPLYTPIQDIW